MRTFLALLVMFAMPLFLPVLPVPGLSGLIAGGLGGYLAGAAGRAVLLALLPAFLLVAAILLFSFGVGVPWLGPIVAGVALIWLAIENVALLLGAAVGGAFAAWRRDHAPVEGQALSGPGVTVERPTAAPPPPAERGRPAHDDPGDRSR